LEERAMDRGILVIDVPEHATAEEAARAMNAPGDAYILVQVLPVPGAHRAYLRYKQAPKAPSSRPARKEADALARMTEAVRATFMPHETIRYRPSLGPESTFYRWRKWALRARVLVTSNGKTYLSADSAVNR